MKKKGFTLLETILVITIISIVSVSLLGASRNSTNRNDTGRDAVNIIYKEFNHYIKDFQRNKVQKSGNDTFEITYLQLDFLEGTSTSGKTGTKITIGNYYSGINTYDSTTLISGEKYTAYQYLRGADEYTFYTRNKTGEDITKIIIPYDGKIYTGTDFNNDVYNISEYSFLICGGNGEIVPIGVITVNAITKTARLDRCKSEKYGGIDCDDFASCQ